jgi:hypothetical protein
MSGRKELPVYAFMACVGEMRFCSQSVRDSFIDLGTTSDYFPIQLLSDYNCDEVCLLRGASCIFYYNSGWCQSFEVLISPFCLGGVEV